MYAPVMKTRATILLVLLAVGAGCSSASNGATSDGGSSGNDGGTTPAPALSCGGILDCIGLCAAADQGCADACLAKGSPDGQAKVTALANCIQANSCSDVACLQTSCSAELTACVDASGGGSAPIQGGGAPATGSLPAELQGEWITTNLLYNFNADGSTTRVTDVNSSGCDSTGNESGVGVASGDQLTVYFTSGTIMICGAAPTQPYTPNQEAFTWSIDLEPGVQGATDTVLKLRQNTCQYTDQDSIDLYCTDKLTLKQ